MRLPSHLTLDFERKNNMSTNWLTKLVPLKLGTTELSQNPLSYATFKKFIPRNSTSSILNTADRYTLKHNNQTGIAAGINENSYYQHIFTKLRTILQNSKPSLINSSLLTNVVNINFLRKERLYTKLKYSRSPAYDIVSGGAAALLAGFIGFLISEKYGFELVDSGDFYYLFMYLVFLSFSLRPLLTSIHYSEGLLTTLSIKFVIEYYALILYFILTKFKYR